MNIRNRDGSLLPMTCCGSMSGHKSTCYLAAARFTVEQDDDEETRDCLSLALRGRTQDNEESR